MKLLVSNIQRFSLHDGPGIRTTIFFKGCNLHCPWCANPENISSLDDYYIDEGANRCHWARYYTEEELFDYILQDRKFYGMDGGVTFSGGEPLLVLGKNPQILEKLKGFGINIAIETALFTASKYLLNSFKYIDIAYVDLKILDIEKCKSVIGGDLNVFMNNIQILSKYKNRTQIIFRMPIVNGLNTSREHLDKVKEIISHFPETKIQMFQLHRLGENKYYRLGQEMVKFDAADERTIAFFKESLMETCNNVELISL